MQVSILLPSVRPLELSNCLRLIHLAAKGLLYEIIIVADFEQPSEYIYHRETQWVYRPLKEGPIKAICEAESRANGEYLFLLSDEDRLSPESLIKLYKRSEEHRLRGEKVILVPWCGGTMTDEQYMKIFSYYGKLFCPFPFIKRTLAQELGGLLDPLFGAHYADPDLGMRAHSKGVKILNQKDIPIGHNNSMTCPIHQFNVKEYFQKDEDLFKSRWDNKFN